MSTPVSGENSPVPVDPQAAGLAATANTNYQATVATSSTNIKSLEDLKEKAPQVYDETMKAIAFGIIRQMKQSEERREKRQAERNRYE